MKIFLIFLLAAAIFAQAAEAKTAPYDSVSVINKAQRDASRFRLKTGDLKKFIAENWPVSSDYFKPSRNHASGGLMNDSLYVTTYRTTAYYKAVNERPLLERHESLLAPPAVNSTSGPGNDADKAHLARVDVKKFNLSIDLLKRFKATPFPNTSNYFKPTAQTTADAGLLSDSTYVTDFRQEAFYKSVNTRVHPVEHVALITTLGGIGLTGIIIVGLVFSRHSRG